MYYELIVPASAVIFKKALKLDAPLLVVASGLTGAETIGIESAIVVADKNGLVDETNDANWLQLTEDANNIQLSVDTNNVFIQAPAYYRFVLSGVPASPVTLLGFYFK